MNFPEREVADPSLGVWCLQAETERRIVTIEPNCIRLLVPDSTFQRLAICKPRIQVLKVDADQCVLLIRSRITVCDDGADRGLFENIGRYASHEQVGGIDSLLEIAVVIKSLVIALPDTQNAEVPAARTAREFQAALDIDGFAVLAQTDAAREKRAAVFPRRSRNTASGVFFTRDSAELEDIAVLKEEAPLLREENGKPRQVYFPCVDRSPGEISVDR